MNGGKINRWGVGITRMTILDILDALFRKEQLGGMWPMEVEQDGEC